MSVASIDGWRLPGCGDLCWPRAHDPLAHEAYGRLLEREAQRPQPDRVVRTGALTVNLTTRAVFVGDRELLLPEREWAYLSYLAERPGQWCSAAAIVMDRWGSDWPLVTYVELKHGERRRVDTRVVSVTRYRLRQRLGAAGALIETGGRTPINPQSRLKMTEAQP